MEQNPNKIESQSDNRQLPKHTVSFLDPSLTARNVYQVTECIPSLTHSNSHCMLPCLPLLPLCNFLLTPVYSFDPLNQPTIKAGKEAIEPATYFPCLVLKQSKLSHCMFQSNTLVVQAISFLYATKSLKNSCDHKAPQFWQHSSGHREQEYC